METVFKAKDGTFFTDAFECHDYEWKLEHPGWKYLKLKDEDGQELTDLFSDETYASVDTIDVTNEEALAALKSIRKLGGFSEYEDITGIGIWKWNYDIDHFVLHSGNQDPIDKILKIIVIGKTVSGKDITFELPDVSKFKISFASI